MKSILQKLDLAICTIWVMNFFSDTDFTVNRLDVFLFFVAVALRLALSFLLERREKKAWIPLALYPITWVGMFLLHANSGIGSAGENFSLFSGMENSQTLDYVVTGSLLFWIAVLPYVVYLYLLFTHRMENTGMTCLQIMGAVLGQDRKTRYSLGGMILVWIAHLVGLSLYMRLCMVACMVVAPVAFWLVCDYLKVGKQYIWAVVVAMMLFWYAQFCDTVLRFLLLYTSLGLVVCACSVLYWATKSLFKVSLAGVVIGIVLPCLSVGYNAYSCIDYPITGRVYASSHYSFLVVGKSQEKEKVGLRDRFGLVVNPDYDAITPEVILPNGIITQYKFRKGAEVVFYKVITNEILVCVENESEVNESREWENEAPVSDELCDNNDVQNGVTHAEMSYYDFDKEKNLMDFFTDLMMCGHKTEVREVYQLELIIKCIAAIDQYRKRELADYPDELVGNCLSVLGAECGYAFHHGIPVDLTFAEWFMMCVAYYCPNIDCLVNEQFDDGKMGFRYFGIEINSSSWWTYTFEKRKKGFEVKLS